MRSQHPAALPDGAECYKTIGPFLQADIPAGLLREHSLKAGVWGVLTLIEGRLRFVWDDDSGAFEELHAPARIIVPPTVHHHLDKLRDAVIAIEFFVSNNSGKTDDSS